MSNCAKVDGKKVNLNNFRDILAYSYPGEPINLPFCHIRPFSGTSLKNNFFEQHLSPIKLIENDLLLTGNPICALTFTDL